MTEKCIICGKPATLHMKNTINYYCKEHAEELFADISYLVKIESEAKKLSKKVDDIVKKDSKE